jgi:hypothetical protein
MTRPFNKGVPNVARGWNPSRCARETEILLLVPIQIYLTSSAEWQVLALSSSRDDEPSAQNIIFVGRADTD